MSKSKAKLVSFDPVAARRRWSRDPAFASAYEALEDEFGALEELLKARRSAGLTQAQVADRMGVAQATIGRLESSAGSRKHAPSLSTLRRYAEAVDCDLLIALVPRAGRKRPSYAFRRNA